MIIGRKFLYLQKSREKMEADLENIINEYRRLGIDQQIDYDKFYLYSLITHSTAMEGSTITEVENQIMFDQGVSIKGKSIEEQNMNLDLKAAYERSIEYARAHTPITTGHAYGTLLLGNEEHRERLQNRVRRVFLGERPVAAAECHRGIRRQILYELQ